MRTLLYKIILMCSVILLVTGASAASFVVKKIDVQGLQLIPESTVLHYIPIKQGQAFNTADSGKVIAALYQTNFFTNVSLLRDNNTLIINVQERPTISEVNISGNKQIPKDKLDDALKKLGLEKGRLLSHAVLDEVSQALRNQYYSMGRYNVKVNVTETPEPRNRVAIGIEVSEGAVTNVADIQILGNRVFPTSVLLDQLHLSTPGLTTFFTRKDEYSEDKLQQSAQDLTNYYLDHGYIRVKVDSSQVSITPDRKHVYIVFKITEGPQYNISGFKLTGDLLNQANQLTQQIAIKNGDVFSRQAVIDSNKAMTNYLGDLGYAFAQVEPQPQIDDQSRTVFINFIMQPGRKYYIRKINFVGNDSTSQLALRKQFYQMEGSLYSTQKIHDSMYLLQQDNYLSQEPPAQVQPVKVDGSNNLLDLNIIVAEKLSAQFQFSIGYSEAYGFLLSTGITQSNFMGTGKTVGFNVSFSAYQKSFSMNYLDPYYTPDGVSRSISVYGTTTNSDQLSVAEYNTDQYGVNVSYGFPLSVYSSLNLGYGIARTYLKAGGTYSSTVSQFMQQYGDKFDQLLLTAGWSRRTTDRPVFPTNGTQEALDLTVSAPMDRDMLQYFKTSYTQDWFQPLNRYFILNMHGILAYGGGYGTMHALPFFQNYYAGGLGTPGLNRAYYPFSLGPQDSNGNPVGGNLLVSGQTSIILPDFFHTPTVRTSVFVDGGNVFNTTAGNTTFQLHDLRYSYGMQVQWWTPLNLPLIFSIAQPFRNRAGDNIDAFQFTIGSMY